MKKTKKVKKSNTKKTDYRKDQKQRIKKVLMITLAIVLTFCIFADLYGVYLAFFAPQSNIKVTVAVNDLTTAEGESLTPIVEVNYFANATGDGLEVFELKLNYFTGIDRTTTYSTGVQYINPKIDASYLFGEYDGIDTTKNYYKLNWNNETYNYNNDGQISFLASEPINVVDQYFLITIGNELVQMKFKGIQDQEEFNTIINEQSWLFGLLKSYSFAKQYWKYDADYFSADLYESVKTLPLDTNGNVTFKLQNLFDFFKDDGEGQFVKIEDSSQEYFELLDVDFNNYFTIKINTHSNGLIDAEDSLFGIVRNKPNFNLYGPLGIPYLFNMQVINLTEQDLNYAQIGASNIFNYGIKESTIEQYASQNVIFVIDIDTEILEASNILIWQNDGTITGNNTYKVFIDGLDMTEEVIA
jgi:hypothetical protein